MKLQKKDANGTKTYNVEECLEKISGINDTVDDINAKLEKISHIEANAEVNQKAFSNVKIGSTTIAADSKTDTLNIVAGSNIALTPDATNDKITIATKDTATFSNLTTTNLTTKGEVEIYGTTQTPQPHIDFHYNNSTNDYTSRIIENSEGAIDILAPKGVLINGKELATSSIKEILSVYEDPDTKVPRLRKFDCTVKYVPIIPAVFVRIYGIINDKMYAGSEYTILNIAKNGPGFRTALSTKGAKRFMAEAKSNAINIRPLDADIQNYEIYIAGFWFV